VITNLNSNIRWKRIARLTALIVLCTVIAVFGSLIIMGARWDQWANTEQSRLDSQAATRDAQFERDGLMALMNYVGYPTQSLREQCNARSSDAIQVIVMPGMSLTYGMRIASLRDNKLTYADQRFNRPRSTRSSPPAFVSTDSLVTTNDMRGIWLAADQIIKTTSSGSTYPRNATDASQDVIEICRAGRYSYFARYMGTRDPSNDTISRLEELLFRQAPDNK
jgi:hypothetical protein